MNSDTLKAKEILEKENLTCVLLKGEKVYKSSQRGVKPLLSLLEQKTDLQGFSAADKVAGKAAAFIYVLMGIKELYTSVISRHALEVLKNRGIKVFYETEVPAVRNRTDTGFCPMETAVLNINDPKEALTALKKKTRELSKEAK